MDLYQTLIKFTILQHSIIQVNEILVLRVPQSNTEISSVQ
jgi:hypothetical protein